MSPSGVFVTDLSGNDTESDNPLEFNLFENSELAASKEVVTTGFDDDGNATVTYRPVSVFGLVFGDGLCRPRSPTFGVFRAERSWLASEGFGRVRFR